MRSVEEIYGELERLNIIVEYDGEHEGWYFHDHTIQGDRGDGLIYETADEAALAAWSTFTDPEEREYDDGMTDAEADADVLRSAGYGTDEDYGFFGDFDHLERDHDEQYIPDTDE